LFAVLQYQTIGGMFAFLIHMSPALHLDPAGGRGPTLSKFLATPWRPIISAWPAGERVEYIIRKNEHENCFSFCAVDQSPQARQSSHLMCSQCGWMCLHLSSSKLSLSAAAVYTALIQQAEQSTAW